MQLISLWVNVVSFRFLARISSSCSIVVGYFFKYSKTSKVKNNLLLILTPYVIKDTLDIERIVQRKMRERNEFVRSFLAFSEMKYRPAMDYRRKRGLLEDINRVVKNFEEIRRALSKDEVVDYVLKAPSKSEFIAIEESISGALDIVDLLVAGYFEDAMKTLHT